MQHSDTTVTPQWLAAHAQHCLILDCRATLGQPQQGRQEYLQNHIPNAIFADLDRDLADPPDQRGRHPLPDLARWGSTLCAWGLNTGQQVVTYDAAGGAFAARAWWMLRWAGHAHVAVLDGGWSAWREAYPEEVEADVPAPATGNFTADAPLVKLVTTQEVLESLDNPDSQRIDARTQDRWAGHEEHIDPVAGHIPGAVCAPFQDNLNSEGRFRPATELQARFAPMTQRDEIISYCGSGVTATHNILAMHIAGIKDVALYPESWSGWITNPERPIECS